MLSLRSATSALALLCALHMGAVSAQEEAETSSLHLLRHGGATTTEEKSNTTTRKSKVAPGPKGSKSITVATTDDDEDHHDGKKKCPKKGMVSVEKGGKCVGGFDMKAMKKGKKCMGGLKMSFKADTDGEELTTSLAEGMFGQVSTDFLVPDLDSFLPDDDTMEQLVLAMEENNSESVTLEGTADDGDDEPLGMSFEFGGFAKMGWGCKVTVSMKKGKLTKTAKCGIKGMEGMGAKPKGFYATEFEITDDEDDDDMMMISEQETMFEMDMAELEWE